MIDLILKLAKENCENLVAHRRFIHHLAETKFDTHKTSAYIENELRALGCKPVHVGGGISAVIEGKLPFNSSPINNKDGKNGEKVTKKENFSKKFGNKCALLRADMDALPICEETGLPFAAKNGCMHACGHDMHAAMLLGAAKVLCQLRDSFSGKIKLLFQPGEEILAGARKAINSGILKNPEVDCAVAIHVLTGTEIDVGSVILPISGIGAPGADFFKIIIKGKSGHVASPETGTSSALAGARIVSMLDTVVAQEIKHERTDVLSIGKIVSGRGANVTPEICEIEGTLRSLNEKTREYLKKRIDEISSLVSEAHKCHSSLEITSSCPPLLNNDKIVKSAEECLNLIYKSGENPCNSALLFAKNFDFPYSTASEDFSCISEAVPSVLIGLSAGKPSDGFEDGLHSPLTDFDEKALPIGAAIYAALGVSLLRE